MSNEVQKTIIKIKKQRIICNVAFIIICLLSCAVFFVLLICDTSDFQFVSMAANIRSGLIIAAAIIFCCFELHLTKELDKVLKEEKEELVETEKEKEKEVKSYTDFGFFDVED